MAGDTSVVQSVTSAVQTGLAAESIQVTILSVAASDPAATAVPTPATGGFATGVATPGGTTEGFTGAPPSGTPDPEVQGIQYVPSGQLSLSATGEEVMRRMNEPGVPQPPVPTESIQVPTESIKVQTDGPTMHSKLQQTRNPTSEDAQTQISGGFGQFDTVGTQTNPALPDPTLNLPGASSKGWW